MTKRGWRVMLPGLVALVGLVTLATFLMTRDGSSPPSSEASEVGRGTVLEWDWEAAAMVALPPGPVAYVVGAGRDGLFAVLGGDEWRFGRLDPATRSWEVLPPPDPATAGVLFGADSTDGLVVVSSGHGPVAAHAVQLVGGGERVRTIADPPMVLDQWMSSLDGNGDFAVLASPNGISVLAMAEGDQGTVDGWSAPVALDVPSGIRPLVEVVDDRAFVVAGAATYRVDLAAKSVALAWQLPPGFEPTSVTFDGADATVWGRLGRGFVGYVLSSETPVAVSLFGVGDDWSDDADVRVHQIAGARRIAVVTSSTGTSVFEESERGEWVLVTVLDLPNASSVIAGTWLVIGEQWIVEARSDRQVARG